MSQRHPWPPEPPLRLAPLPIPGKRRLGCSRVLVVVDHTATAQDCIRAARELLAGTGLTIEPERHPR
ncbi:hypothetical protein HB662_01400 [Roseomonas frigidaquae]|uniref:Uncharacterized protein n=1 Tax=Falsiroseomonas frigidaquae TaxID=487318 RepID=A0ABX1EVW6_9PROT|nr:hypothetical protein [Falsiroseomonas frigidaquae]NKE43415.1 hypothetical protein [Falsiroseomonas frigidaquae]